MTTFQNSLTELLLTARIVLLLEKIKFEKVQRRVVTVLNLNLRRFLGVEAFTVTFNL